MELEREEMLRYHQNNLQYEEPNEKQFQKEKDKIPEEYRTYKIGTFSAVRELAREVFSNRPNISEAPSKKTWIAIFWTVIIIIALGIILWFIPFTNGWMRELIFENLYLVGCLNKYRKEVD